MDEIKPLGNFFKLDVLGRKGIFDKMVALTMFLKREGNNFPWGEKGLSCLGEQLLIKENFLNE